MKLEYDDEEPEEWELKLISNVPFCYQESVKELRVMAGVGNASLGYPPLSLIEAVHLRRIVEVCVVDAVRIFHEIEQGELSYDQRITPYFEAPARWVFELYGMDWISLHSYNSRFIRDFQ